MGSKQWVNDSGTWRQVNKVWVNDAGTWRQVRYTWINDSGTWRQVYQRVADAYTSSILETGTHPTGDPDLWSYTSSEPQYPSAITTVNTGGPLENNVLYVRGCAAGGEGSHNQSDYDGGGGAGASLGTESGAWGIIENVPETVASISVDIPNWTGRAEIDACGDGRSGEDLLIILYDGENGSGTELGRVTVGGGTGGYCGGTGGPGGTISTTGGLTVGGCKANGSAGTTKYSGTKGGSGGWCHGWGVGGSGGTNDQPGNAADEFGAGGGGPGTNRSITGSGAQGIAYIMWREGNTYTNTQTFTTGSGSWTVPAGVTKIHVDMVGAGGGGGGGADYGSPGGGAGGHYIMEALTVTPGANLSYSVGAGGTGGGTGTAGGNTTFSTLTATGGGGGTRDNQGAAGTPNGQIGEVGNQNYSTTGYGGAGGYGQWGTGGAGGQGGGPGQTGSAGGNATGYGSGGGGGGNNQNGGTGSGGYIKVYW